MGRTYSMNVVNEKSVSSYGFGDTIGREDID
jgi:hypothetical protein